MVIAITRLFLLIAALRMLGLAVHWLRAAWARDPSDHMLKHASRWLRADWHRHRLQLLAYFLIDAITVAMLITLLLETFLP